MMEVDLSLLGAKFQELCSFFGTSDYDEHAKRKWETFLFNHFRWDVAVLFEWLQCFPGRFNIIQSPSCWELLEIHGQKRPT